MLLQIIKYIHFLIIIVLTSFLVMSCTKGRESPDEILFDFESDRELDQLNWKCHIMLTLSEEYPSHGKKSLKMELYPSDYPGLNPYLKINDWSNYKSLCFDMYNPEEKDIRISIRIDDKKDSPDYSDRYNGSFVIKPGMNEVEIELNSLTTSRTKRKLNLKSIEKFLIFMTRPADKIILYIDYIRLESS